MKRVSIDENIQNDTRLKYGKSKKHLRNIVKLKFESNPIKISKGKS